MVKLLISCLNLSLLLCLFSCKTDQDKAKEAYNFGMHYFEEGSVGRVNALIRALECDTSFTPAAFELANTYLKRGLLQQWRSYINQAVMSDSVQYLPFRGYAYLWYFKDYKKALSDFNSLKNSDVKLTKLPEAVNLNYWRGIAYLGAENYRQSVASFSAFLQTTNTQSTAKQNIATAYLYRGIALYKMKAYKKARNNFSKLLEYSTFNQADAFYYLALIAKQERAIHVARKHINSALVAYKAGHYNKRPDVETLHQIYLEDLLHLKNQLTL
ncbi:hypothetical protein ACFSQP_07805 [Bizionia sediminis]|uniref:Tetratricopeptide repeat protein n=1 Tax=Bizionia sediminis TaxID=1737064 RepID=A0ABW5KSZ5_9FLAO